MMLATSLVLEFTQVGSKRVSTAWRVTSTGPDQHFLSPAQHVMLYKLEPFAKAWHKLLKLFQSKSSGVE
jgi:hypothetical protein